MEPGGEVLLEVPDRAPSRESVVPDVGVALRVPAPWSEGGKGEGRAQHDLDEPVRWPKEAGTLLRCSKPSTRVEDIAEHSACSDAPKGMSWQPGSLTAAARQLGK